jgi:phosphopantothenoylcysteine decarboxylase / phosphopantothenate---cysteine ligase
MPESSVSTPRILLTSGPTHEPIDSVRFLGNRSSGQFGAALADCAAMAGHPITVLQGPAKFSPRHGDVRVREFRTCSDLQGLLREEIADHDILIMAAAVADYRPKPNAALSGGKFRRTSEPLTLELEPTPDLLAEVGGKRRAGQLLVGFALEPRAELLASARAKLVRKRIDMIVANPLEAMDSARAEVTVVYADGREVELGESAKAEHAPRVLGLVLEEWRARARSAS